MNKKLDYRKLIQNWMQFYEMTAERTKKMFVSILVRMQETREKKIEKGGEIHGTQVERMDRKGEGE